MEEADDDQLLWVLQLLLILADLVSICFHGFHGFPISKVSIFWTDCEGMSFCTYCTCVAVSDSAFPGLSTFERIPTRQRPDKILQSAEGVHLSMGQMDGIFPQFFTFGKVAGPLALRLANAILSAIHFQWLNGMGPAHKGLCLGY